MKSRLFLLIAIIAMVACQSNDPVERQIDNLLSQMTLEEKIAQMVQINGGQISDSLAQQVRNGAGSMLNSVGAEANHYQRIAVEESRLGIPMIFARDVIHGFRTIFPIPLGQAATFNPAIVEEGARIAAEEAMQAGLRWTFSPMVDVARDPRWGRVAEGYGEDTYLASVMGAAAVRGYQGNDSIVRMAACVKHFAGYSASEGGRDYNSTWIPEIQLRETYLPPFKAAIDAGSLSIMCAFNDLNGVPASGNKHLNVDILRDEWQFDGVLVSDWASLQNMNNQGNSANLKEATQLSINAQMDIDMESKGYPRHLKELVEEFSLEIVHKATDYEKIRLLVEDVSRPGLQLAGYFYHFEPMRLQVIGNVESSYLDKMTAPERTLVYDRLFSYKIPALLAARGLVPGSECLEMAKKHNITILRWPGSTSSIVSSIIMYFLIVLTE